MIAHSLNVDETVRRQPNAAFARELARFGPDAPSSPAPGFAEASAYCRQLAQAHYENFTVASWLLPRALRPHFHHIYAYCRWADDLADETCSSDESILLLNWWEQQLDACFAATAHHPVFVALTPTIQEFAIPKGPFADLLKAFRQDQWVGEYHSFPQLLEYCQHSANPVGRLVLHLGRCHDAERGALSDSICTGLQLANFWQDVARDCAQGRFYLPRDDRERFGYTDDAYRGRQCNPAFAKLMEFEVSRAEQFLRAGFPLLDLVPRWLRMDVSLFIRGGLAILAAIREERYNVWQCRPTLSKWRTARLFLDAAFNTKV
ncbi:MAG: squalene synthase HpnC [Planctomycetia bacterium]|nr:squalene synthase HpnC [Planctomycetia bacterium]